MSKRCFLIYPCGKKFEIRAPIYIINTDGNSSSVLPGTDNYYEHAKKKFEINNLKVIEMDIPEKDFDQPKDFISLSRKVRSIE